MVLFLLAVVLLIVVVNIGVAGFFYFSEDYNIYAGSRLGWSGFWSYFSWERFGWIALAIAATVAVVVLVRWIQLSTGGKTVAESMGAERVLANTEDPAERRCMNIVAEMALAAGMPVPPLYIMNDERGINAFAAGITTADAVVVVTRGTAEHLRRHELQGVIAHEFSHILNGDMRLNIRLAALLGGITFIADSGHVILRSGFRARRGGSGRKGQSSLPALGLLLLVTGWLGTLAAKCIKAAISRQKEYLADAAAVQFTRDPSSIGDALKVIGGYVPGTLVHAARAEEMSHLFFARVEHALWDVFGTHPPLERRIRRIEPGWDGRFITRSVDHARLERVGQRRRSGDAAGDSLSRQERTLVAAAAASMPDASPGTTSAAVADAEFGDGPHSDALPPELLAMAREPLGASAVVLALLLDRGETVLRQQRAAIADASVPGLVEQVESAWQALRDVEPGARFTLLENTLPALKSMSSPQYRRFRETLLRLIRADGRTALREWCYYQLLRHYLDPEFGRVASSRPRYRRLQRVVPQLRTVISMMAHQGSEDTQAAFDDAVASLEIKGLTITPKTDCSVAAFGRAVRELADCYPLLKPRILKALCVAASRDGEISAAEREIVSAVAAVMDCPLPPAWTPEARSN